MLQTPPPRSPLHQAILPPSFHPPPGDTRQRRTCPPLPQTCPTYSLPLSPSPRPTSSPSSPKRPPSTSSTSPPSSSSKPSPTSHTTCVLSSPTPRCHQSCHVHFLSFLASSNHDVQVASFGAIVALVGLFTELALFHKFLHLAWCFLRWKRKGRVVGGEMK
ncbi:hypothetical protein Fmac_001864 [Flemingia macrophylla]|uniref:Uncharacterized protein n=1 Tax=Flemingia macrophylla TaxID=520843 RepID=A0ABD1NIB0_9FABA